ncbi:hypothetical protein BDZ90DRAFT_3181 [Jaminaea rosea]|uniref:Uncharacterized protein n=1 Tax=Jaminaea rosea TaxID=1569628 RepID=A0A316UYG7_9BASI|nr:hypothetical protein BDZ90DRAFT_3181 [Jaminaea rosea]PWN30034.1 hypothetical protein BDZ90DRAFT_3181 [Jaminaea rosea]
MQLEEQIAHSSLLARPQKGRGRHTHACFGCRRRRSRRRELFLALTARECFSSPSLAQRMTLVVQYQIHHGRPSDIRSITATSSLPYLTSVSFLFFLIINRHLAAHLSSRLPVQAGVPNLWIDLSTTSARRGDAERETLLQERGAVGLRSPATQAALSATAATRFKSSLDDDAT